MKASDALIIGSAITTQIRGTLTDGKDGRCALGAMCEAAGIDMVGWAFGNPYSAILHRFPIMSQSFSHPVWGTSASLYQIVYNLNDAHNWSRERIAAFMRDCERISESIPEAAEEPCQTAAT